MLKTQSTAGRLTAKRRAPAASAISAAELDRAEAAIYMYSQIRDDRDAGLTPEESRASLLRTCTSNEDRVLAAVALDWACNVEARYWHPGKLQS